MTLRTTMSDEELATWLARRRAKREPQRIWVLLGDPGVDCPQLSDALEPLRETCEVDLLEAGDRAERVANATAFEQPPNVLVFGDMHVILQDALVMGLCRRKDVRRVLVSTHRNDDLMEAAREFCTVDSHLILPECSPDLPVEICKAAGIDPSILS